MEQEKSSGVEVGPPISIVRLVLMLTTVGHQVIPGSPIVKGNNGFGIARSARQ